MFDPRADIISLFSNSKVSVSTDYDGKTDYMELCIRERNPEGDLRYDSAGGIILEPPFSPPPKEVCIGGQKHVTTVIIPCRLWLRKREWIKNRDTFLNSVISTFQTTIRTNRRSIVSNGDVEFWGVQNIRSNDEILEKMIMIKAYKFE